ncbi:putative RNA methyltransferase [Alicyclobacillus cellulosilyticus]|uniref:RNA methyltransferase n=1 Tax=Alicyclobacillus cellulosilyticus TaxID=1003997 RepID=A0A917K6K2_9BACL|nr:23S rRNA (uracil(1939)-C(5))-methyltransferase RlmD [Alicyclobacillus cellulosilyticus]GGI99819.1 putative RNA methyltransferase [Alicyclobacillus cellulosilyticus]
MRAGERHLATAVRLNDDGEGIAYIDGLTVFVPGLLPGEQAWVEVTQVARRYGRARLVSAPEPVPTTAARQDAAEGAQYEGRRGPAAATVATDGNGYAMADTGRVLPKCAVFGACGGCQLQHLAYPRQLEHKRRVVEAALRRIGRLADVPVAPVLGMDNPWRYRNQIQVPLRWTDPPGRLTAGFFAMGSHELVPTEACHLASAAMEQTVRAVVRVLADALGPAAADVHHLIVRESYTTGEQMVVLVAARQDLDLRQVVDDLLALPRVVSVCRTVQPYRTGPVWGPTVEVLGGKAALTERIEGLEFLISPRSFFQVNTAQARVLYAQVVQAAALQPTDVVLDAYCGTGTIALVLARQARKVVGVEQVPAAVADARRNAAHNGIAHAVFLTGAVERILPRLCTQEHFDVVVLDPPRKGCAPQVLAAVVAARPRRIIYVSCNPATLARDLRVLADGGFVVRRVQPVDMFPQTSHIECCALLDLSGAS